MSRCLKNFCRASIAKKYKMGFLTGVEIRRRIEAGQIEIQSLDGEQPFSINSQVTEDSIDLRLAPVALALQDGVSSLDYLGESLDKYFDTLEIGANGFELEPLKPILAQTLEAVCFPDNLVGLVFTRSTFARLGIATTCLAPKFAAGIHWAFPLQIVNLNRIPIRIYPYAPMVQLMISDMTGVPIGYRGKFQDSFVPMAPSIGARERESLSDINPSAVNRTFHIINHDLRSRALAEESTSKDNFAEPTPVAETSIRQPKKIIRRITVVTMSTLAAIGFGIVGNLISGGSLSYWEVVSLVLLITLSAILTGSALVIQSVWRDPIDPEA